MKIDLAKIKRLREITKAGVMDCRRALEECGGDFDKAKEWLIKKGASLAKEKANQETKTGIVEAYVHTDKRLGAMVKVLCETDFVARSEIFKNFAKELAMQVAAMNPQSVEGLLDQEYIRDPKRKIKDLLDELIGKIKENIKIQQIVRLEV